ncbi:MAG TPA: sigma factor-like helix-turn-helix DNA-binding protein [Candidatus Bipolaricaulota bacterium]|nr:sigma factor-like helix-turn-helix DNA-binding protein [Candidatus Bipolaricaulota bacterium]
MVDYSVKNKQAVRQLLDNLFSELPGREKDVLIRRNQLLKELSKGETLKEIGDEYNITRERVRQIENEGIKKLLKASETKKELIQMIEEDLLNYVERNGGAVLEQSLLDNFVNQLDLEQYNENAVLFVYDKLIDTIVYRSENGDFHSHWHQADLNVDHISELLNNLISHFEENKKPFTSQELFDHLSNHELVVSNAAHYDKYLSKYADDGLNLSFILQSYLNLSKKVKNNILDQWGLAHWPEIKPKKLSEKIYLVFLSSNKPLHFNEVAEKINSAGFDRKNICSATVHNELIANEGYTLVGRGIYALKAWGYHTGTVADVIEKILQESGPMEKDAIYEAVLKQRLVNKSTIYLSLINKDKFVKGEGNKFLLK